MARLDCLVVDTGRVVRRSEDCRYVAVSETESPGVGEQIRVLEWPSGKCRIRVSPRETNWKSYFLGDTTFALCDGTSFKGFDLPAGKLRYKLTWPFDPNLCLTSPLPDGRFCGIGITENIVHLQILSPDRSVQYFKLPYPLDSSRWVATLSALSAGSDRFALGAEFYRENTVDLKILEWDCDAGRLSHTFSLPNVRSAFDYGNSMPVLSYRGKRRPLLAVMERGEPLGVGEYRHWLSVWDVARGEKVFTCEDPALQETGSTSKYYDAQVAFSPDGKFLACVCDNRALLWDVHSFFQKARKAKEVRNR